MITSIAVACHPCRSSGRYCGLGRPDTAAAACVVCGTQTHVRSACGAPRCRADHYGLPGWGPLDQPPAPVPPNPPTMSVSTDSVSTDSVTDDPFSYRLVSVLEKQLPPLRRYRGKMAEPYWRPPLPGMMSAAHVITGFGWHRPFTGEVVRLDANAAYLSSAATVLIPHFQLKRTGPMRQFDPTLTGYALVQVHPWLETDLPHPLGRPDGDQLWVPWPTLQLLAQLVDAGRWPDAEILDSYTSLGSRLTDWTNHCRDLRIEVIDAHGRDSTEYDRFKKSFNAAWGLFTGSAKPGQSRKWKCGAHRPDWTHTVMAHSAANKWRLASEITRRSPAALVSLAHTDEMWLPAEHYPAACELMSLTRPDRPVLRIDQTGRALGTWKIKGREQL